MGEAAAVRTGGTGMLDSFGQEVLNRAQSLELLGTAGLGRVVFTDRGMPAVQPVRFALDEHAVRFHVPSTSVLAAAARGNVLAFEADSLTPDLGEGWWVTVLGHANPHELTGGECVVRISLEVVAGRRLRVGQ
ncbi:pyridoxamine 5'-phosphate oxidase family protein [Amycolatopsis magusensis]|uniref:Nitroimidazol reductase NimA-like FMN-containing flavoprotein (Pyridoxamine 5'-phosphate oxidase superfamily) n=2 Tax=Amycolatopsis magusensis TaxID=882444 RepID=A0ABS4PL95_9PSEU|nr:pyridoxamine 5'-phosphate oxidase family protein [Amycolatopsis magusensis]MBP2179381.1 nitroimidazol reductase NimA-like FMN-containing flavoprotein (pyridoxamine 5'-phosphate oxidase superfamily) [Amycolatopsis magusensis]